MIAENIEYDILSRNAQLDKYRPDELAEPRVDTVCSNREMIRAAVNDHPAKVIRSRFLKLKLPPPQGNRKKCSSVSGTAIGITSAIYL